MPNWTEEQLRERNARVFGVADTDLAQRKAEIDAACPNIPEALIEAECTKMLEEDGWRALRTDPVSRRAHGKGFGELGMADHLYIRYEGGVYGDAPNSTEARVMWIEFKRPGERPKKHQVEWHARERARGALTLIAGEDFPASVEGFAHWYRKSGLQGRPV